MTQIQTNHTHPLETRSLGRLTSWLHAASDGLRSGLHTIQCARMLQALSSLSDHQLAEIGIARQDIPQYAARLMSQDEGGKS